MQKRNESKQKQRRILRKRRLSMELQIGTKRNKKNRLFSKMEKLSK
jgi:hypothetical protein